MITRLMYEVFIKMVLKYIERLIRTLMGLLINTVGSMRREAVGELMPMGMGRLILGK